MSFESKATITLIVSSTDNMGASFNSDAGNVTNALGYSIQASWTAGSTPVGSLAIQASNDGHTWVDIGSSTLAVSGNTGSNMWNFISGVYYNFARLVYTRSSGNGTLTATLVSKG